MKNIRIDDYIVIAKYDSDIERVMPNGENTDYVEGYECTVYRADDTERIAPEDYFTLGFGYEISDISDDQLLEGIKCHMGLVRTLADSLRDKYHVNAMDEDFADALAKDVQAALSDVEQRYGVKLTCSFNGHPKNWKLFDSVGLELIATMDYSNCEDPEQERFALSCYNNGLVEECGIDASAYGKSFVCADKEFRIVGFKQTVANFITVDCEGSLYQFPPKIVGEALRGNLLASSVKNISATMAIQRKLSEVEASDNELTFEKWLSVLDQYRLFSIPTDLTSDDWGKVVHLYGKDYTVSGFQFNLHTKRRDGGGGYRVILAHDGKHFIAPMRIVAYALAHAAK